jgi:hypothetical protein
VSARRIVLALAATTLLAASSALAVTAMSASAADDPPANCVSGDAAHYGHDWGSDGKMRVTLQGTQPLCEPRDFAMVTWLTGGDPNQERRWAVSSGQLRDAGQTLVLDVVGAGNCQAKQALYSTKDLPDKVAASDAPASMDSRASGDVFCTTPPVVSAPVTQASDCPAGISGAVIGVAMTETDHFTRSVVLVDGTMRGMLPLDSATPGGIVLAPGLATGNHSVTVQPFGSKDTTSFPPVTVPLSLVSCANGNPAPGTGTGGAPPLAPGQADGSGDGLVPPQAGDPAAPPAGGAAPAGYNALAYTGVPANELALIGTILLSLGIIAVAIPLRTRRKSSK